MITKKIGKDKYEQCKQWNDAILQKEVIQFIRCQIIPCLPENSTVDLYSYCKINGNIIRGDPLFRDKTDWHDWFYINNFQFEEEVRKSEKNTCYGVYLSTY